MILDIRLILGVNFLASTHKCFLTFLTGLIASMHHEYHIGIARTESANDTIKDMTEVHILTALKYISRPSH